jgi:hypothetical protein
MLLSYYCEVLILMTNLTLAIDYTMPLFRSEATFVNAWLGMTAGSDSGLLVAFNLGALETSPNMTDLMLADGISKVAVFEGPGGMYNWTMLTTWEWQVMPGPNSFAVTDWLIYDVLPPNMEEGQVEIGPAVQMFVGSGVMFYGAINGLQTQTICIEEFASGMPIWYPPLFQASNIYGAQMTFYVPKPGHGYTAYINEQQAINSVNIAWAETLFLVTVQLGLASDIWNKTWNPSLDSAAFIKSTFGVDSVAVLNGF